MKSIFLSAVQQKRHILPFQLEFAGEATH